MATHFTNGSEFQKDTLNKRLESVSLGLLLLLTGIVWLLPGWR